jgi:hypothetical protein
MKIFFRILAALVLVGLLASGAFMAYKAGVAQGISQAPAVATAISQAAENGQAAPIPPMMYGYGHGYPYGYGYGYPYGMHHFGFFPVGGLCFGIFFLFLFFGFLKMVFFRRMMWSRGPHGHHGPWSRNWEGGAPSMFNEWHKRAHEAPTSDGEKPAEEKKSE